MCRVTTHWHLGDISGRKNRNSSIFPSQYHSQVAQMLLEHPFQCHQAASIPALCEFRWLLHQAMSPSPSMFGALGGAGLAGHKLSMSTKDRHGAALCFSKITLKRGFHIRPPTGSKGKVSLPACYSNFGEFPPSFGNKNGLLMPALMLTKARWNKKSPAPQNQHPISSQRSFPSRTSSRTFQEPLVALQSRLLSSASPGHLWVCPGPPQHRMALCHPLVAYTGWQACCGFEVATSRTPGPGKAGGCLQHPPYSSIPALAFCSQGFGRLSTPRGLALPAPLPHESGVSKAISSSRKSFPPPRHPCSPHAPGKPRKVPAAHSDWVALRHSLLPGLGG